MFYSIMPHVFIISLHKRFIFLINNNYLKAFVKVKVNYYTELPKI